MTTASSTRSIHYCVVVVDKRIKFVEGFGRFVFESQCRKEALTAFFDALFDYAFCFRVDVRYDGVFVGELKQDINKVFSAWNVTADDIALVCKQPCMAKHLLQQLTELQNETKPEEMYYYEIGEGLAMGQDLVVYAAAEFINFKTKIVPFGEGKITHIRGPPHRIHS